MTAEELYHRLKIQILNGELTAGERLGEIPLAKQYGLSRLYVKSALQRLREERLAEHITNRGYFVRPVPDEILEEINDLRRALEWVLVRRVIEVGTEEEIGELSRIFGRISVFIRNDMPEDGLEEVGRFYDRLGQIARYDRVAGILHTYSDYISIIRRRSAVTREEHLRSLEELKGLMEAIETRDSDRALAWMRGGRASAAGSGQG